MGFRATLTTIVINNTQTLFDSNGDVYQWQKKITREVRAASKAKAPPRRSRARWSPRRGTGELNRSIRGDTHRIGATAVETTVGVHVYYAKWVLHGTAYQGTRYIYSSAGWQHKFLIDPVARRVKKGGKKVEDFIEMGLYMKLPLAAVGGTRSYFLRVHGQRANNFLIDGYNEVAHVHGALRPMANKFAF